MVLAVLDTNVLVSGLIATGIPRRIWLAAKTNRCRLAFSPLMLREVRDVLIRPKFHKFIHNEDRNEIILYLESCGLCIEPKSKLRICRDPEDNEIINTAITAKVDAIVTGDKDLLTLKTINDIPIITPRIFLEEFIR